MQAAAEAPFWPEKYLDRCMDTAKAPRRAGAVTVEGILEGSNLFHRSSGKGVSAGVASPNRVGGTTYADRESLPIPRFSVDNAVGSGESVRFSGF